MNDKKPASLSSDLLARKGEAQPFSVDPSERMTPYLSAESGGSHFGGGPQFDPSSTAEERAFPPEPEIIFTPEELEEGQGRGKIIALVLGVVLAVGGIVFAISFNSGDRGTAPVTPDLVAQAPASTELRSSQPSEAAPVVSAPPVVETAPPVEVTPAPPVTAAKPVETRTVETRTVETKAVETKPVAQTPVKTVEEKPVTASGGAYVVQLLALRDEAAAEKAWAGLQKKHPSLQAHASDVERADLGDKGIFYRLRAAGFGSKAEAQSFCASLKAAGQDCMVKPR